MTMSRNLYTVWTYLLDRPNTWFTFPEIATQCMMTNRQVSSLIRMIDCPDLTKRRVKDEVGFEGRYCTEIMLDTTPEIASELKKEATLERYNISDEERKLVVQTMSTEWRRAKELAEIMDLSIIRLFHISETLDCVESRKGPTSKQYRLKSDKTIKDHVPDNK